MGIAVLEAGYPVGESKCWSLLGMRDWMDLQVFLATVESVKPEVKEVKIIAAVCSGRRYKTSCLVECVRPSNDELTRLFSRARVRLGHQT